MVSILTIGNKQPNKLSLYRNQVNKTDKIIDLLTKTKEPLMVKDICARTGIGYPTCSKYLSILHARGTIGLKVIGNAKVYFFRRGSAAYRFRKKERENEKKV